MRCAKGSHVRMVGFDAGMLQGEVSCSLIVLVWDSLACPKLSARPKGLSMHSRPCSNIAAFLYPLGF